MWIGTALLQDSSISFYGKIDDIRIYNRALSDDEITQLFNGNVPPPPRSYEAGYEAGKQACIDNPAKCDNFTQEQVDAARTEGREAGRQECINDPESCCEIQTPIRSDDYLSFSAVQPLYNVGDTVVLDLSENLDVDNRFKRVDLWVAIELPKGSGLLFMTTDVFNPFSRHPQPFKESLDIRETTHRVLEFEVKPGLGGNYGFYAVYVKEGENPMTSFLVLRSNIATANVVLSNR
jgi:hypothetical protein